MERFRGRVAAGVQRLVLVVAMASTAAVGSERMFWFWAPGLTDHLIVTAVYTLPIAVSLWVVARYRVSSWWSLMLVTPIYALVTEGALTPVVYTGGPFVPVFPAWFAAWHGLLALGVLVFGLRHLLLRRRIALLATVAAATGVFWGVWSATLWLPENVDDPDLIADHGGPLHVLDPVEFGRYAITFTVILALGQWLMGCVWPTRFEPARPTRWFVATLVAGMVAFWTIAVPWALPMFAAYAALQWWGLRRHARTASGPDLFEHLAGPTPVSGLLALAPMAVTAGASYWVLWSIDPAPVVLRTIMWTTIALQGVAGFVVAVVALRRAGRGAQRSPAEEQREPPSAAVVPAAPR